MIELRWGKTSIKPGKIHAFIKDSETALCHNATLGIEIGLTNIPVEDVCKSCRIVLDKNGYSTGGVP